ncbi:hypothetical protein EIP86_004218 [Pleurotus ostreatoroseus]|nr:hypothetical protein EIP86_004218 [Pleurotus ostreatoroseus]
MDVEAMTPTQAELPIMQPPRDRASTQTTASQYSRPSWMQMPPPPPPPPPPSDDSSRQDDDIQEKDKEWTCTSQASHMAFVLICSEVMTSTLRQRFPKGLLSCLLLSFTTAVARD